METPLLIDAINAIPRGAWAVGVSGGADSVALLLLLRQRNDLRLHVAHLNHQTRGQESDEDARFVAKLTRGFNLDCTVAARAQVEATMQNLPSNPSARYRDVRRELFRRVVEQYKLDGVILAHHADDQAETVLHRLLRGSAAGGLSGMKPRATFGRLTVLRPLLPVRRETLRTFLNEAGQLWREDSSNSGDKYFRNRLRRLLSSQPQMIRCLLELADACRDLRDWSQRNAPRLAANFAASELAALPRVLAAVAGRNWLADRGVPREQMSADVLDRLLQMAADAASPPAVHFPGRIIVRRRNGRIFCPTARNPQPPQTQPD